MPKKISSSKDEKGTMVTPKNFYVGPPNHLLYVLDSYLIYYYGGSGVDPNKSLIEINCYTTKEYIGRINFYLDGHVPPPQIISDPFASGGYLLSLTFNIDRAQEIINSLRQDPTVIIEVNTAYGTCNVNSRGMIGKLAQ